MIREVLQAVRDHRAPGLGCVFCSVVETRGSTPQKPGAVMAVFANGTQKGTLGGGCVEAEVRQQALQLIDSSAPKLLTFTLDDDFGWDDGLICGGKMIFAAQPITSAMIATYFERLEQLVNEGAGCTEAVVTAAHDGLEVGTRFLFDSQGRLAASLWAADCPQTIGALVSEVARRPRPTARHGIACVPILPRCRLVIVGAGHVGQAVARLAQEVDFDVWVIDDRAKFACAERFPTAQRILVGDIGQTLKDFPSDLSTYFLIVTRGHTHDEEALFHLVRKPSGYLGMIGSHRKIRLIFDDLVKDGIEPEKLEQVYAPLGIDIGSQTVPEIAVSIVAQLVGRRNRGMEMFPPPSRKPAAASP